jgi:spermidine/putrescine transport system substrate-binding protein
MKNRAESIKTLQSKHFLSFLSALILFFAFSCTQSKDNSKILRLSIWPNYISEEVIKSFEADTGIKVETSYFSSNEELYAKLKAGGALYDLVVPSDYMIEIMSNENMLEELGDTFAPAKAQVDAGFLGHSFDAQNIYSLPYAWTATGIAYNTELLQKPVVTWLALFSDKDLKAKLGLLDDGREVIGAALKAKSLSLNTESDADLAQAKELLKDARSRVKLFTSEPYLALSNKEIAVAQIYSSDALQLQREGSVKIEFIIPEEGASFAIDSFAMPKGAANKELAQKFVEYMLSPAHYKVNFESQLFGPVVKDLAAIVDPVLRSNPVLFLKADKLSKLENMKDLGEKTEDYDRLWTEFKAQ